MLRRIMAPSRKHLFVFLALVILLNWASPAQAHFGPFIHPFFHPFWGGFGYRPRFLPFYNPYFFPLYVPPPAYVPPYNYSYRPITYTPAYSSLSGYGSSASGHTLTTQAAKPDEQKGPEYQGKTVKEWIKSLTNWDSHVR